MKKVSIHKRNEFVRGADGYSLLAKRAMNAIYWAYQKHGLYSHSSIPISFSTLRQLMHLETTNAYVDLLKEALLELKRPIELNNFYHPVMEVTYRWYATSFINDVGFRKSDNGDWVADIEVPNLIKYIMQQPGNFTMLELVPYLNRFRTKYAMKLYEYLKSFSGYGYLEVSQAHMMRLLGLSETSKYRYMSDLTSLLDRQLAEIASKSDLSGVRLVKSKSLRRSRLFRIVLNPSSSRKVAQKDAQEALEGIINRF